MAENNGKKNETVASNGVRLLQWVLGFLVASHSYLFMEYVHLGRDLAGIKESRFTAKDGLELQNRILGMLPPDRDWETKNQEPTEVI